MPDDDDGDLGVDWLNSQLSGKKKPEEPEESTIEPAAGRDAVTNPTPAAQTGGFIWGLTPTIASNPKLAPAPGAPVESSDPDAESAQIPEPPKRPEPAVKPEAPFEAMPATRVIRSEVDLEPAPWWTTPVQAPLVPTEEEEAATELLRTPVPAASVPAAPAPLDPPTGVAPIMPDTPSRRPSGRAEAGGGTANTTTRTLIRIAASLLAVVVLVGLFFLGQKLVGGAAPVAAPAPSATPTATPTPTPTVEATGPQPVGVHAWDTLRGGECLQPYTSPWEEEFTVVDCAAPHAAQLVYRGVFAGDAATAFPGETELAAQINLLCSAPGVIDLAAAGAFPDVQVQGSYPVTDEQWASGQRHYYCFVSRSSAEPLTASVAGPGPAPVG